MESPMDDGPSEAASSVPWHWVIQALASCKEIQLSTLQDLIDIAPVMRDEFCTKTREFIAMRCLEGLFSSTGIIDCDDASASVDSKVGFDFSLGCQDALQQILNEIPLSNLKMAGAELLKWDFFPFIKYKRASSAKCDLEQLKESIFEGTHPYTDYLKERSGLALQNGVYPVHANDDGCNELSEKDDRNCTYSVNRRAKENSVAVILENVDKSSKKHLDEKSFLPSTRKRIYSADENVLRHQHEKQVGINECDDFLMYAKKIRRNGSSNIEFKKEKPAFPRGKGMLEKSTDKFILVSERGECGTENDIKENLGEGSLEGSHDKCVVSNWCRSSSHNEVFRDELNIPDNAAVILQHTSGGEYCQHREVESIPTKDPLSDEIQHASLYKTKDDTERCIEPIPKDADLHKVPCITNEPQSKWNIDFQLEKLNASSLNVSQQPVTGDKAVDDTNGCGQKISSDSDGEHNETVDLAPKRHEFLSLQCTVGHDSSPDNELTENNLCMKCNKGGELLVCKTTSCPLMVHKSCLGAFAQFDADGNFFCPFCSYCHAISEYLEAKKKASLARKELAIFIQKDIGCLNTTLHEVRRKERSFSRKSSKYQHIDDKNNGNDQLPGAGDYKDRVGKHKADTLHVEGSQHLDHISCVNSSRKEKEIVNNGISGVEERGEVLKSLTSTQLEENQVPAEHVDGDDNLSREKPNVLSVNQSNTEEIQLEEMLEQDDAVQREPVFAHDSEEEDVSEDERETPTTSRYAIRFRKH